MCDSVRHKNTQAFRPTTLLPTDFVYWSRCNPNALKVCSHPRYSEHGHMIRSSGSTLYVQRDGGNDGLLQIIFSCCGDGYGVFRSPGNICGDRSSTILVSSRELVGEAYSTATAGIPASATFIATPALAKASCGFGNSKAGRR